MKHFVRFPCAPLLHFPNMVTGFECGQMSPLANNQPAMALVSEDPHCSRVLPSI